MQHGSTGCPADRESRAPPRVGHEGCAADTCGEERTCGLAEGVAWAALVIPVARATRAGWRRSRPQGAWNMSGRPHRSPPRRMSASPEGDIRSAHRDRRHGSKEDVLNALGGRISSPASSPRSSIDAAAAVPLALPAPPAAARGSARPPMKPMRRPPQRPDVANAAPPELEPESEPEPPCDDGIEPWLREAQLLEAAIGTFVRTSIGLESPHVQRVVRISGVVWCASRVFAAAQRAAKDKAPAISQAPARRLSDGTSSAAAEFCATFLKPGPLGLNLTSSDDGCGTMILAIQQGTQAENYPELVPGLVLTAVGSTLVAGRTHEAVTRAIVGHPERPLMLRFTRPNPNSTAAPPPISKALPPPPIVSDAAGMDGCFSEYDSPGAAARARTPPRVRPGSPVSREELAERSARELLDEYGGSGRIGGS